MPERDDDYPSFDEAVSRFSAFAREQGAPTDILFVCPADVAVVNGQIYVRRPDPHLARERASHLYEAAVSRRRGVVIAALCTLPRLVCTYVYGPVDDDEAMRLMFPNGLKMSLPQPLRNAEPSRGLHWWRIKMLERLSPVSSSKAELFK
jgi:hypothetical protein